MNYHVNNNYKEVTVPFIVSRKVLEGTGHLPKFADELFQIKDHKFNNQEGYLIPTAEVCGSSVGFIIILLSFMLILYLHRYQLLVYLHLRCSIPIICRCHLSVTHHALEQKQVYTLILIINNIYIVFIQEPMVKIRKASSDSINFIKWN